MNDDVIYPVQTSMTMEEQPFEDESRIQDLA